MHVEAATVTHEMHARDVEQARCGMDHVETRQPIAPDMHCPAAAYGNGFDAARRPDKPATLEPVAMQCVGLRLRQGIEERDLTQVAGAAPDEPVRRREQLRGIA